jgi:hypothetical protein
VLFRSARAERMRGREATDTRPAALFSRSRAGVGRAVRHQGGLQQERMQFHLIHLRPDPAEVQQIVQSVSELWLPEGPRFPPVLVARL